MSTLRQLFCALAAASVFALAGCGQKGPLYLPHVDKSQQEQEEDSTISTSG